MNPERVSEKKHWNDFWNRDRDVSEVYDNENRVSRHLSEIAPIAGMKVLEVGAGTGRDGILMARQGSLGRLPRLQPGEPRDHRRPAFGRTMTSPSAAETPSSLPFPDGTFDLVFHQGLLEHFRNPREMLVEHRRVLRDGGLILVDVPQRWHYYTLVKRLLIATGRWFAGWETEFSPRELESLRRRLRIRDRENIRRVAQSADMVQDAPQEPDRRWSKASNAPWSLRAGRGKCSAR